jgi:glycosyltransferase involved in cell wall biosynthesis
VISLDNSPEVLVIEFLSDGGGSIGGGGTFVRTLIDTFGSRLALLGLTTSREGVGRWTDREVNGQRIQFLSLGAPDNYCKRTIVPGRVRRYFQLRRNREKILSLGLRKAIVTSPEYLMAVHDWGWSDLCYMFLGAENPLYQSRYPFGSLLAKPFDALLFRALKDATTILAHADGEAIENMCRRSKGALPVQSVHSIPVFFDNAVFHPADKQEARRLLSLPIGPPIYVFCGRLNRVKGWDLVLQAFMFVQRECPQARLILVGDGEDRPSVDKMLSTYGVRDSVSVTGIVSPHQVARYLNAADALVCGSHYEGWSHAFVEALGCGKAIVTTNVSGASKMVKPGVNGFIVNDRDPRSFAQAMVHALSLVDATQTSLNLAESYSQTHFAERLGAVWKGTPATTVTKP